MPKHTPTTKDISLLYQLYKQGQLDLAPPEFQRNAVWPRQAKAYLIDTILNDRVIPLLFFRRTTSPQTGRQQFEVVDGQQRLRAIIEFLENRLRLSQTEDPRMHGKLFRDLDAEFQDRIWQYDLLIMELMGFKDSDIIDIFVRMNKYVVKLSPQEIRNARDSGVFFNVVRELASLPFWTANRVFSKGMVDRFRHEEFVAELLILLIEGPQDKKESVDLYYKQYSEHFPDVSDVRARFFECINWIEAALPNLRESRLRKPVDLYSLFGALSFFSDLEGPISDIPVEAAGKLLTQFTLSVDELRKSRAADLTGQVEKEFPLQVARYFVAASRQTDNIRPRLTRIDILQGILYRAYGN